MNEKDNRWLHIWGAELSRGKSIPESKTDAILQFMFLDDILDERPYTCENGCYKPNTIRIASNPFVSTDTSITVVIMGFVEVLHSNRDLRIVRDVYVRLESKELEDVEAWQFCIASFFSFLFSCRIYSGMRFNMEDEWADIKRILPWYGRTGTPEAIERASRDYLLYYEAITPVVSDVILSWANYYFSHEAIFWGIHKYLENVNHEHQMPAALTIATICEAFEQCSSGGKNPNESMKEWAGELTKAIPSVDENLLAEVRNGSLKYYQNSKHFNRRKNWSRQSISHDEVVAQTFFMKRFFQLKILYIVLKDNLDVFHKLYPRLVEDADSAIQKAYGSTVFN